MTTCPLCGNKIEADRATLITVRGQKYRIVDRFEVYSADTLPITHLCVESRHEQQLERAQGWLAQAEELRDARERELLPADTAAHTRQSRAAHAKRG